MVGFPIAHTIAENRVKLNRNSENVSYNKLTQIGRCWTSTAKSCTISAVNMRREGAWKQRFDESTRISQEASQTQAPSGGD
jgi:hypothetical protein